MRRGGALPDPWFGFQFHRVPFAYGGISSGGAVQYYSTGLRVRSFIQEFERARFAGSLGTIAFRDSHRDRRILRLEVSVGYY